MAIPEIMLFLNALNNDNQSNAEEDGPEDQDDVFVSILTLFIKRGYLYG